MEAFQIKRAVILEYSASQAGCRGFESRLPPFLRHVWDWLPSTSPRRDVSNGAMFLSAQILKAISYLSDTSPNIRCCLETKEHSSLASLRQIVRQLQRLSATDNDIQRTNSVKLRMQASQRERPRTKGTASLHRHFEGFHRNLYTL
jgi:hypothetical protein